MNNKNRITIFATDVPFPPNRGGRADIWRRMVALQKIGFEIQLVAFFDDTSTGRPSDADKQSILEVARDLQLFPIEQGLLQKAGKFSRILRAPWHVLRRTLSTVSQEAVNSEIRKFSPHFLWCEGPWCALTAQAALTASQVPLVYRSHNIEHLYMRRQATAAKRFRDRLAWSIACFGLKKFERQALANANWIFDISSDDMAYWQAQGVRNISWLPPVAEGALKPLPAAVAKQNDVVFLGNLTTPNNVRGVQWLVEAIWPLVRAARPATNLVIAGSNPGPFVRALCEAPGVQLMANVADALGLYASARVLVNPVRTGSGTHIKAIEMLMMDAPIVTATQGTMGMPPAVKQLFTVADTPAAFADAILQALAAPQDLTTQRALARQIFGVEGLARAMAELQHRLQRQDPMPGNRLPDKPHA